MLMPGDYICVNFACARMFLFNFPENQSRFLVWHFAAVPERPFVRKRYSLRYVNKRKAGAAGKLHGT